MEAAVLIKELICAAKLMRLFAQDKIYSVGKKILKKTASDDRGSSMSLSDG